MRGVKSMRELSREPELRYKDVERLLTQIFKVSFKEEGAFRARLRHLRNKGIPKQLPTPGSGAPIGYTRYQLIQMIIGLELSALGIAPRHAADLTERALELESKQELPRLSHSTEAGECEKTLHDTMSEFSLPMKLNPATEPVAIHVGRFQSIQGWNNLFHRLRNNRALYLIIHPKPEFSSSDGYDLEILELNQAEIAEKVSSHVRISFVNLSSAFKMLDQYLKRVA